MSITHLVYPPFILTVSGHFVPWPLRSKPLRSILTIFTTRHSWSSTVTEITRELENITDPKPITLGNESKKLHSTKKMNIFLRRGTKYGQLKFSQTDFYSIIVGSHWVVWYSCRSLSFGQKSLLMIAENWNLRLCSSTKPYLAWQILRNHMIPIA